MIIASVLVWKGIVMNGSLHRYQLVFYREVRQGLGNTQEHPDSQI